MVVQSNRHSGAQGQPLQRQPAQGCIVFSGHHSLPALPVAFRRGLLPRPAVEVELIAGFTCPADQFRHVAGKGFVATSGQGKQRLTLHFNYLPANGLELYRLRSRQDGQRWLLCLRRRLELGWIARAGGEPDQSHH